MKGQIDLTEADSVRKSQATSDIQKTAQDLLKNTFTSEPDKQLLNSDLAKIIEAKTEKSVNSAVKALNATISDTQKHNKPAADKAKADRQAEKLHKLYRPKQHQQRILTIQLQINGRLKMVIIGITAKVIVLLFHLEVVYPQDITGRSLKS